MVTRFEKARILGARALQIAMGAPLLMEMTEEELEELRYSPIEIAKKEYEQGLIPIETQSAKPVQTKNI